MKEIIRQNDSVIYYELVATPSTSGKVNFETNTKVDGDVLWNRGRITLSYEDVLAMMNYFEEVTVNEETNARTVKSE